MLSRHFELDFNEDPDFLIYGEEGAGEHLHYSPRTIRIFITGENVQPNWNEADYALTHERIYSDRHWRVPLHRHWYDTTCTVPVRDFRLVKSRVTRFCNFIYSNERAAERIEFFKVLSAYKQVDSGGKVLNNLGHRIDDKLQFISQSKFTIAFENESREGYATEKLIQPLLAGSIPIYWGDPTAGRDFNPECFINVHEYPDFAAVVEAVRLIDSDDRLWEKYVTAPIFRDGKLPQELSDEAIVGFFERIFSKRKAHVPAATKLKQRLTHRMRHSPITNNLRRILSGVLRRIKG
jgi:hypothetical protein